MWKKLIIWAGGKIILEGGKIILAGLFTTRQSHPVRAREAREFLINGMWGVVIPGLVTTRQSHLVRAREFLNNGMWGVYSPGRRTGHHPTIQLGHAGPMPAMAYWWWWNFTEKILLHKAAGLKQCSAVFFFLSLCWQSQPCKPSLGQSRLLLSSTRTPTCVMTSCLSMLSRVWTSFGDFCVVSLW